MGSTAQLYNLGWNQFDSSLKSSLRSLRVKGDLMDVTLAAGGKTFPAHKVILSAASPLLFELLKVTPCQHPVILLAGIGAADLESLLEFVYNGEVNIHSTQLPSLLQAAHILNIHGLTQGTITAEHPEDQNDAIAAMEASSAATERLDVVSLAVATNEGLVAASAASRRGRKSPIKRKRRGSDKGDKFGKYDSDGESSDMDTAKEVHIINTRTRKISCPEKSQQVGQSSSAADTSVKAVKHAASIPDENPESVSEDTHLTSHHFDLHEDENDTVDNSYGPVAAAADAAALAASLLADKKGSSEQPAACPLCNAVIRQSRNLRRHLEIRHFGKKLYKGKFVSRNKQRSHHDETDADSLAEAALIEHVKVEMKSPSAASSSGLVVTPSTSSSTSNAEPSKIITLAEMETAHQHHTVETYLQQQQLQHLHSAQFPLHLVSTVPTSSTTAYQVSYPHLSLLRENSHSGLNSADSVAFRSSVSNLSYSSMPGNTDRSSSHQ